MAAPATGQAIWLARSGMVRHAPIRAEESGAQLSQVGSAPGGVGAAGISREAVNRIDGTQLAHRPPETDALDRVEILDFASAAEVRQRDPGLALDTDHEARVYSRLISHERGVGCCALNFTAPGTPLAAEEANLLVILLEQVGQSLARPVLRKQARPHRNPAAQQAAAQPSAHYRGRHHSRCS